MIYFCYVIGIIGIVAIVGWFIFIIWLTRLTMYKREILKALKKFTKNKISHDEFIKACNKYNRVIEKQKINNIRREKLKKLRNL
jgi:hypothetical protein